MSTRKSASTLTIAVAACLLVTACGGSDTSSSGGSGSGSGEVSAESKKLVEEASANPTSVGYDQPLSKPVPSGKKIVALEVPVAVAQFNIKSQTAAAKDLGWELERIVVGNGPEDPAKAFDEALDQKPDGIYYSGYPTQSISKQLDRAKAEGIPVFAEALGSETPDAAITQIRNTPSVERIAKVTAAWIAVDSKAKANVLIVDAPAFPILHQYTTALKKEIETQCGSCKVSVTEANVTDIGTALPGQIVSELQKSPQTNYLAFSFGDLTAGMNPALQAAGLLDKVRITGELPGLENYKNLKSGEDAMWVPEVSPVVGYRIIDAFARHFTGDDPAIAGDDSPVPIQILTKDNIGEASFNEDGFWNGTPDVQAIFKKMWNVS
jgi:ribose transport system substrate-binding protein